ncbi:MAG TPA: hypothetical protein VII42_15265, partial [Caulobacteraceae bacterium]
MEVDSDKLGALVGTVVGDMGAAMSGALVVLGDKLGLYKALAAQGPAMPGDLAARTGCAERYVREWLSAQAAGGYIQYDKASGQFSLSPEQAVVFAAEGHPAFMAGG